MRASLLAQAAYRSLSARSGTESRSTGDYTGRTGKCNRRAKRCFPRIHRQFAAAGANGPEDRESGARYTRRVVRGIAEVSVRAVRLRVAAFARMRVGDPPAFLRTRLRCHWQTALARSPTPRCPFRG